MKTPTLDAVLDEYLVTASQNGDRRAMRILVARWTPRFRRLANRYVGDREAALDVAQDAWIGVIRGLDGLRDPSRFRAWSYRIVANKARDHIRREQTRRGALSGRGGPWMVELSVQDTTSVDLREAINRLSGEQRTLLWLYYGDDLSVGEIAAVLGVPRGTVKSRLFHARQALKSLLAEKETP